MAKTRAQMEIQKREEEDNKSLPVCVTWEGDWEIVTKNCSCDVHKDLRKSHRNKAKITPDKVGSGRAGNTTLYLSQIPMGTTDSPAVILSRVKKESNKKTTWNMMITPKTNEGIR